MFKIRYLQ
jgi:hypothetical protein